MKKLFTAIIFASLLSSSAYGQGLIKVKYDYTLDGDTISVYSHKNNYRVRLYGIDCFEIKPGRRAELQAKQNNIPVDDIVSGGKYAKYLLGEKIGDNKYLYLDFKGVDMYGRAIAVVYMRNALIFKRNLNKEMSKTGYCPVFIWKGNNHYSCNP